MILDSSQNIARALRVLACRENYPLMVHCTHGKDRTGLVVALVLRLLGVSDADIVADYELSDAHGSSEVGRAAFAHIPQLVSVAKRVDVTSAKTPLAF